jgi:hypothetical protein
MSDIQSYRKRIEKLAGDRTPLEKAIRRSLVSRSSGRESLHKHALSYMADSRAAGATDDDILRELLDLASEVACATGNDRSDVLTGQPRWAYVADDLRRLVDSARIPGVDAGDMRVSRPVASTSPIAAHARL